MLKKNILVVVFILLFFVSCNDSNNTTAITTATKINETLKTDLDVIISNYIVEKNTNKYASTIKQFEVHKIYGQEKVGTIIKIYMYSLFEGYNLTSDKPVSDSGCSFPILITVKTKDNIFKVIDCKEPKDGSLYASSIKEMFPKEYAEKAINDTGHVEDLQKQMNEKAQKWFKLQKQK